MIDEVWRHLIEKGLLVVVTLVLIRYVTAPLFRPKAEIDAAREGYEPAARARDDAAKRREKAQLDVATYEQMIANAGVPLPWSQPNLPLPKISSASSVPPSKDLNPQPSSSEALSVPSQSPVPTGSATKSSSLLAQFLGSTRGPQNV